MISSGSDIRRVTVGTCETMEEWTFHRQLDLAVTRPWVFNCSHRRTLGGCKVERCRVWPLGYNHTENLEEAESGSCWRGGGQKTLSEHHQTKSRSEKQFVIIKCHITNKSTICGIQVDVRSQTEFSSSKLTSKHWFLRIFYSQRDRQCGQHQEHTPAGGRLEKPSFGL